LAPLDRAKPADLSFLASARYARLYERTQASAVLIAPEFSELETSAAARIIVERPHDAMLTVLPTLYPAVPHAPGVHPTARIGRGATLGQDVTIGAYAVIGDGATIGDRTWIDSHVSVGPGVAIGADSRLFPSVTLYSGTKIGARVSVHAGSRVGSDGFGYVFRNGVHDKIPHVGRCIIEDDVEIGANTTIDRGSIDDTVIGAGTKIDNLVQIGHNCRIGRHTVISGCTGIAGSATIGAHCMIGGAAMILGHLTIADQVHISAGSFVARSIAKPGLYTGIFPIDDNASWEKNAATLKQLHTLRERLKALEKKT